MSNEFKWDDEAVMEFYEFHRNKENQWTSESIEQFKASKQPKKEWEITALRGYGEIYPKIAEDQFHISAHTVSLDWALKNKFEIYSVTRLSDGEVFSIGDEMTMDGETKTIIGFETLYNKHMMACHSKSGSFNIIYAKKVKVFLFTTIDGVNIFEGDHYYFIDAHWEIRYTGDNHNWVGDGLKAFSTKEKAEDWLLWNKPILSLNDVKKCSPYTTDDNPHYIKIIQIAKDKLNLK